MENSIDQTLSGGLFNVTTALRGAELLRYWFPSFSAVYYGCFLYLLRLDEVFDFPEELKKKNEEAKVNGGHRGGTTNDSKALTQARLSTWVCWVAALVLLSFLAESYILVMDKFKGEDQALPAHHDVSFTFSVTLLWLTAFLNYIDHSLPLPKTIHACWASVFLEEFLLFSLSYRLNAADHRFGCRFIILQGARVFGLTAILVLVGASARIARTNDEKSAHDGVKGTDNVCCESSEKNSDASASTANKNGGTSGDQKPQVQTSTWTKIKICFRFWYPSDSICAQLQLLVYYICVMTCEALRYLETYLLSDIITAMSDNLRVFPLKKITLYVSVKLLYGKAGLETVMLAINQRTRVRTRAKVVTEGFRHLMAMSANYHDQVSAETSMVSVSRAQVAVQAPSDIFGNILPRIGDVVVSWILLYRVLDKYMALGAVAVSVFYIWISTHSMRKSRVLNRQFWTKHDAQRGTMYQCLNNWRTLVYFNRISSETRKCTAATQESCAFFLKLQFVDFAFDAVLYLLRTIGTAAALFMAAHQIVYGGAKVGILVMVLEYWDRLISPLELLIVMIGFCLKDLVRAEQFIELINQEPQVKDKPECPDLVTGKGEVVFEDVKFHYEEKHDVLKGISFHAKPGQTVAFVGESGAGKSTILNLLVRLYDCTSGSIKIDGQEVSSVSQTSLRDRFGIVPQEPTLFNATILDNLRFAKPDATEEEIYDACRSASLHDKFMSFPRGYQTKVGGNGIKLSGGEKQRVAIARALLTNPTLVLLDEATSSVDSKTEAIIQESLSKLCANRTTFVTAHRLSTIRQADQVLVIHDGRVAETGTHDELIAAGGIYHELWKLQSGAAIPFQKEEDQGS